MLCAFAVSLLVWGSVGVSCGCVLIVVCVVVGWRGVGGGLVGAVWGFVVVECGGGCVLGSGLLPGVVLWGIVAAGVLKFVGHCGCGRVDICGVLWLRV